MRTPIHDTIPSQPVELPLYEDSCPIAHFTSRIEPFGFVLIRDNHIVSVVAYAKPILDARDGPITLCQVQQRFGQEALNLVGSLYQAGVMELV